MTHVQEPAPAAEPVPVPKYFRVKEALLARIASGGWTAGTQIPSEPELCREFAVSRTTVRKAIGDLVHEGRLAAVQGKGTFVAGAKLETRFVQRAFGIHEDMQQRGIELRTQLLRRETVQALPPVARRLRLRPADPVQVIVRLRSVGGEPVLVSTTYLPRGLADLSDDELREDSLYRLLQDKHGLWIAHGQRRLEAVAAGPEEARLLEVALGSPLLLLETVAYREDGQPFEYSVALQRGDRIAVELDFFPARDGESDILRLGSTTDAARHRPSTDLAGSLREARQR